MQFSRVLSTQSCSKTYGLNEAWKATGREDGKSLGQSDFLFWNHAFSCFIGVTVYRFMCQTWGKPPSYVTYARCCSVKCSALKVLAVVSQVTQSNRVRGVSLLLHLPLDCVSKNMGLFMRVPSLTALLWSGEAQACRTQPLAEAYGQEYTQKFGFPLKWV